MSTLDVCVVGEINLDLILYGLPKELVLDRELSQRSRAHVGQFVCYFCSQPGHARE
jgi:hypothetical protein